MDLSRQLQDALMKESLMQKSKTVHNKITTEQLKSMTEHFRSAKTKNSLYFFHKISELQHMLSLVDKCVQIRVGNMVVIS